MRRRRAGRMVLLTVMVPALTAGAALAVAQSAARAGNAARGRGLFLMEGCYTCHGTTGTGAITGPRLAPAPIPWVAYINQLRRPRGSPSYATTMPMFGERVLSDAQAADIYAYLASIRPGPPAARIPLLNEP